MSAKTEQNQALLGEEEDGYYLPQPSSRREYQWNFKRLFYVLLSLNLITLVLVGTVLTLKWNSVSSQVHNSAADIFPAISLELREFHANNSFYKILNDDQTTVWDSLTTSAGGFVRIDDPQKYGLSGGYPLETADGGQAESYCVSVFHQLHCLDSIRIYIEQNVQPDKRDRHDILSSHRSELHVAHCIDYLRQAVMCCGDMSLEKAVVDRDGNIAQATNGWGANHTCKKWDEIFDITERMNSLSEIDAD